MQIPKISRHAFRYFIFFRVAMLGSIVKWMLLRVKSYLQNTLRYKSVKSQSEKTSKQNTNQ